MVAVYERERERERRDESTAEEEREERRRSRIPYVVVEATCARAWSAARAV